jgi:hypothetical protein
MHNGKALLVTAFASLTLITSQTAESVAQAGGLPRLEARVSTLEVTVEDQGLAGAQLGTQVEDLQTQLSTVQNDLLTLQNSLMFAVVDANGTLRARRGV